MGSNNGKPLESTKQPSTKSTTPLTPLTPCTANYPAVLNKLYLYLLLAFVAGVLLTLLVTAISYLIKKSCPKHSTSLSQQISQASDPSHKSCPTMEEGLTYATLSLQASEENRVCFAQHQAEEKDPNIYAQVRVQSKNSTPSQGSREML